LSARLGLAGVLQHCLSSIWVGSLISVLERDCQTVPSRFGEG